MAGVGRVQSPGPFNMRFGPLGGRGAALVALLCFCSPVVAQEAPDAAPPGEAPAPLDAAGTPAAESQAAESQAAESQAAESQAAESQATPGAAGDAAAAPASAPASDGPTRQEFEALAAQLAELQSRQEEAELEAALTEEEPEVEQDLLSIYGFMDMGMQRYWTEEGSLVRLYYPTDAVTFVVGNIDFYFDINPHPDWRALSEIRFTAGHHGQINNYGGIGGEFERQNNRNGDPHQTDLNVDLWRGSVVIERAWIEWNKLQSFRLRVGSFFTPFGIWNVDHGQPTLISIGQPQFIQQRWMPTRQVGVQALGSFFTGEWELAYRAWVTNGRQELAHVDFTDDKAFGGRLIADRQTGKVNTRFGASYHYGRVEDQVVAIQGIAPFEYTRDPSFQYDEHAMGVDASVDIQAFRARTEFVVHRQIYKEGLREPVTTAPGALSPDNWKTGGYLLLAYQTPWIGMEPYLYGELMQQTWTLGDLTTNLAFGFNFRFNPAVMLKTQFSRVMFFNWKGEVPNPEVDNTTGLYARLVLAF